MILMNILLGLICFLVFCLLQGLFINGVKSAMGEGMVLEKVSKWINEVAGDFWSKPLAGCIKCMSSFYGAITFWPMVIYLFGFMWVEIPLFIADIFILVSVNWWLYKKL